MAVSVTLRDGAGGRVASPTTATGAALRLGYHREAATMRDGAAPENRKAIAAFA
jgi:hypothetical protein